MTGGAIKQREIRLQLAEDCEQFAVDPQERGVHAQIHQCLQQVEVRAHHEDICTQILDVPALGQLDVFELLAPARN